MIYCRKKMVTTAVVTYAFAALFSILAIAITAPSAFGAVRWGGGYYPVYVPDGSYLAANGTTVVRGPYWTVACDQLPEKYAASPGLWIVNVSTNKYVPGVIQPGSTVMWRWRTFKTTWPNTKSSTFPNGRPFAWGLQKPARGMNQNSALTAEQRWDEARNMASEYAAAMTLYTWAVNAGASSMCSSDLSHLNANNLLLVPGSTNLQDRNPKLDHYFLSPISYVWGATTATITYAGLTHYKVPTGTNIQTGYSQTSSKITSMYLQPSIDISGCKPSCVFG